MATPQQSFNRVSWETSNGFAPKKGPRCIPLTIDFGIANPQSLDLVSEQTDDKIEFIQAVYVDNSNNPGVFILTCGTTGQVLTWPAFSQGYQPVLMNNPPKFTVQTFQRGETNVIINISLLTFPVPSAMWQYGVGITQEVATIAAGATVSSAVDLKYKTLCGIQLPAAFTGVVLSFQTATTLAGTYQNMYQNGVIYQQTVTQGTYVILTPSIFAGVQYIKIVSGTAEGAARTLELNVRPT